MHAIHISDSLSKHRQDILAPPALHYGHPYKISAITIQPQYIAAEGLCATMLGPALLAAAVITICRLQALTTEGAVPSVTSVARNRLRIPSGRISDQVSCNVVHVRMYL